MMTETETESHASSTLHSRNTFEKDRFNSSLIPSHSTDFAPDEESLPDLLVLPRRKHSAEKECLFNTIFVFILLPTALCFFASILIAVWGEQWLNVTNS